MSFTNQAKVDTLRTLAFGSITGSYVAVGSPLTFPARIICFTNTTNEDVTFSMDGSTDQLIVPAGSFKLFDVTTNHRPVNQDDFCFTVGTQWYVKYVSAPSSGAIYLEVVYAQPTSIPTHSH
jgi:hypothetical protein